MSEKPSILMVVTQGAWGGAQRYIYDLATGLADSFYITVAVGEPGGAKDLQAKLLIWNAERGIAGVEVVQLNHLKRAISPSEDLLAIKELRALYQKLNPDVVHLNSSKAGVIGSFAKNGAQPKIVYTVHGWVFDEPIGFARQFFYRQLEKISAKRKDAIILLSSEDATRAKILGNLEKKLTQISLGIELDNFLNKSEAREKILSKLPITAREKTFWFGTVANSFKTKGLDVLIKAAADEKIKNQAAVIIVGAGPELDNLKRLVTNLNLQNTVFFTDAINEAATLLKAFDVFVLPSRKEGTPYVILEAIQAQLPIIATRVGGIPSVLLNKKSGWMIKPDSVTDLNSSLVWCLEHQMELVNIKANAGVNDLAKMLAATSSLYWSLLEPRKFDFREKFLDR